MHLETKFIKISHPEPITLDYSELGDKSATLFLHGGGATHYDYANFLFEISKHSKVYAFTMPGYARSQKLHKYNVENLIDTIEGFTEQIDIDSFNLVGQSLGGGLAMQYVHHFPKRVNNLSLISPLFHPLQGNPISVQLKIRNNDRIASKKLNRKKRIAKSILSDIGIKLRTYNIAAHLENDTVISHIKIPIKLFVGLEDIVVH